MKALGFVMVTLGGLTGCSPSTGDTEVVPRDQAGSQVSAAKESRMLRNAVEGAGVLNANVQVTKVQVTPPSTIKTIVADEAGGVRIRLTVAGLAAGTHGLHVHEIGRCDGPAFTSAGAHWNPTSKKHGRDNPAGAHLGDLDNLIIGPDGRGSAELVIAGARLTEGSQPLFDDDGAALLIHAAKDDYRTDPGGDSGDRILCSVLQAAR